MAEQKKAGRTKRSRLGRGLSALVESPVVIEVAAPDAPTQSTKSDNLNKVRVAGDGGDARASGAVGAVGAESTRSGGNGIPADVASDGDGKTTTDAVHIANNSTPRVESRIGLAEGGGGGDEGLVGKVVDGGVLEIPVGLVTANRDQPRREFDEESLGELAASIREHGVMQPITVRVLDQRSGAGGGVDAVSGGLQYELIAGERRLRASVLAGLAAVPAIVRVVDDATSAQLALIENVQREDLNVVELAQGYRSLSDRYSMTQSEISKTVGVSRSSVANVMRLLELPGEVRVLISEGVLSGGHGKALLSLGSPEKQRKFASRCIKEGWSVRELERQCVAELEGAGGGEGGDSKTDRSGTDGNERDQAASVLRDLEVRVGEELGTRVKIRTDKSRTRGRVVIEFYDLDQFDGLLGKLGVRIEG